MTDYKKLVKFLRGLSPWAFPDASKKRMNDAAAAIEALQAEVESSEQSCQQQLVAMARHNAELQAKVADYEDTLKWHQKEFAELRAMIDDANTKMPHWVSVEDELPKPRYARKWYLVALESGCVMTNAFDRDRNEWWETGSPVTHWMPLPEPPKEDA